MLNARTDSRVACFRGHPMKAALALVLLPALALAAPPQARRVSTLLVPMDPASEASSVQMEGYMNDALTHFAGMTVRKSEELFGMPEDPEARASLERGRKGYSESLSAFDKKDYEEAERKVRATLKELQGAAGAMRGCSPLCDALALYAAVLHLRGEVEEAKLALIDLIALSPTHELSPKRFTREFLALRVQVATSRTSQLRGTATVNSRPAGARVYVDGEVVGYTPVTLPALPIGKHLLRLERPGFRQYGQLMEVATDDAEVTAKLVPTSAYKAYDAQLDRVAGEVNRAGEKASGVAAMAQSLGLERVMVGTLRANGEGTDLTLGYYDARTGQRLAGRRMAVQGDEFGQLKQEMERVVNHLVNSIGEKVTKSRDPLDNRGGMEDWSSEDRGGRGKAQDKKSKPSDDPLDGVSGTEDW
ncbi:PEGA domain-containing protein [Myxococcus xanthus]|uniref:PEGA domain-containing protein n=2 Tax=Myxococcaceae TaxID=31 RepID=A0AAE6FYG4_MYXXA|nr:PEGA domain-containing protein [Myxococcus xanthus]QDE74908.1 PEGA domain-containing protein [Myxococcus xanthus]QDE82176.1 PEGA domain-containing protein [Myxococcus xanthus]QDE96479.1 PEGA domain-containing protein [Myxococcus xanthus]QDF03964.1 PEGA domain-containing protein [Myxococcus xanthus]